MKSALTRLLSIVVLLAMVVTPVLAIDTPQADGPRLEPDRSGFVPESTLGTKEQLTAVEAFAVSSLERSDRYVILFEDPSLVAVNKGSSQLDISSPESQTYLDQLAKQRNSVMASVESTLGRSVSIKHVYDVILNGVSVEMSLEEAQQLAKVPGIRQILSVSLEQPDTDAGPSWIGADGVWDGSADPADLGSLGEGMLVGIIDTGINFDHPSFSDTPQDGFVYDWTGDYLGVCAPAGDPAYATACNDKLVGAYTYTGEAVSPEDSDGHGSHTGSTVAGNYVTFEFMGVETTISGVVPHAQIISFDVCDESGCWGDDSAAAVEQAIIDGVDALNYSISGGKSPYTDVVELAFLEAFGEDIFVAASGGNLREEPSTDGQVNHLSPWVTTVAASSHNRKFTNDIDVVQPAGSIYVDMAQIPSSSPVPFPALDDVELKWAGLDTASMDAPFADNRQGCQPFPADFFDGDVALIRRGVCAFADKLANAQTAGAIGMLVYADNRPPIVMGGLDTATLPAGFLYLSPAEAATFADWVGANAPVLIDMSETGRYLNDAWGDIKADFSYRGPSANNLQVLKPDVTAPGLEILAAVADGVIDSDGAIQAALYQGTSMSSPHTAGAGALLSAVFPEWTVAQVKSALMLTAERDNLLKEDMETPADLFDFGAGRVDLEMASLTGLTMDETYDNMDAANPAEGGDMKTLNIASLYNSLCVGECSWTRTFTSVADAEASYTVTAPTWVTVEPASFTLAAGGTQVITVTADVSALTADEWQFAYVLFETDSLHSGGKPISDAAIPVAVLPVGSNIPEFVSFETHRNADMGTIPDLLAGEITAGNTYESGLVKADLEVITLDPDPTNGDPFDDLSQVYVKVFDVPAYSIRLVAEVTETTSSDVDMFLFWDANANGTLEPETDVLIAQSATATALEYINGPKDWIFWNTDDTYLLVVQNWAGAVGDTITLASGIVPLVPEVGNYDVVVPVTNPGATPFELDVYWYEDTEEGDRLYGYFDTCADAVCDGATWIGSTDIDIRRLADDVVKTADVESAMPGDTITYTIEITNFADVPTDYTINDVLPAGVTYVPDSVTGGAVYDELTNAITWSGTVDAPQAPYYNVTDSVTDPLCDTGFGGYVDLAGFGIPTNAGITGDTTVWTLTPGAVPYNFYGIDYPTISFTDDGFAIFDYANNYGGAPWVNQAIPDTAYPNNLAAMLWQDMEIVYDAATNKGVSIASAGASLHIIEYDDVQIWGDPTTTYDFEIVHNHVVDDTPGIYEFVFAYDNINGPLNLATIGTENFGGTAATQYAYNDASFTNGHMICFDQVTPSTTQTITFQVTVDTIPDQGLLINEALHDTTSDATFEEAALAVVQLPWIEPKLNEFSISTTGDDVEYLEFIGNPETDYSEYTFLAIEGDWSTSNTNEGKVDNVIPLGTTDANGLYLVNLPYNTIENGTISLLLVKGNTAIVGDDLDTNDDGVLEMEPWTEIVDSLAIHDGGSSDLLYTTPVLGQNYDGFSSFAPGGASRIPDGFDTDGASDWVRNDFDLAGIQGYDGTPTWGEAYNTPGAFNEIVKAVTFNVTVPAFTPALDEVYIVGNQPLLGNWDPGLVSMEKVDDTHWTLELIFEEGTELAFKFTRGNWDTVMKGADGNEELANLTLTVAYDETGHQIYDYTVLNWRDPLVTAVTPLDGSIDVPYITTVTATWSQSIAADSCLSLLDAEALSVAGSCVYDDATKTITFTPSDPLAGHRLYTATASGIVDVEDPAIVQQEDYTWSFTTLNTAPVAVADTYSTPEDTELIVTVLEGVLFNDTDVDGDTLTVELVADVANGELTLAVDGSFTYLPDADFYGGDSFIYKIYDGGLYSNEATVTLTITAVNDAPVGVDDQYSTDEEVELVILVADGVLANDSDVEGQTLTAELDTDAHNGTLNLAADGSFTYLPDVDFFGEDSFTYKVYDGELYSEVVTVTITVNPINDAPTAVDDEYTVVEDGLLEVAAPGVMENDIEVDFDNMVVALVTNVEHGSLILLGDGSFTYRPDEGFSGIDTFTYQLITYPNSIQSEWTDEATVTITVTPLPRIYLPLILR